MGFSLFSNNGMPFPSVDFNKSKHFSNIAAHPKGGGKPVIPVCPFF
jgi:hypothetical protein